MIELGLWGRLEMTFGVAALRPKLAHDVRVRRIGDEAELVQISTRRVVPIDDAERQLIEQFDGSASVAELIIAGIGAGGLRVEPIVGLIDRLVRADMLGYDPPQLYDQLSRYLGIDQSPTGAEMDADPASAGDEDDPEGVEPRREAVEVEPWRARSTVLAQRARFLRSVTLFASLDMTDIGALTDVARAEHWGAGSVIVSEGGRADRFFVVASGEVIVQQRADTGSTELAHLGVGMWFGETALRDGVMRNATVRVAADRDANLLSFDEATFDRYIRPFVEQCGDDGLVNARRASLEVVPVFAGLHVSELDLLTQVLREVSVEQGETVVRQGELADRFYVIASGAVGVVKDGRPIAKLTAGEFFGETALLFTEVRIATVVAIEPTRLWVLERAAFETYVRESLLHRSHLMPTVMNRIDSDEPI